MLAKYLDSNIDACHEMLNAATMLKNDLVLLLENHTKQVNYLAAQ